MSIKITMTKVAKILISGGVIVLHEYIKDQPIKRSNIFKRLKQNIQKERQQQGYEDKLQISTEDEFQTIIQKLQKLQLSKKLSNQVKMLKNINQDNYMKEHLSVIGMACLGTLTNTNIYMYIVYSYYFLYELYRFKQVYAFRFARIQQPNFRSLTVFYTTLMPFFIAFTSINKLKDLFLASRSIILRK